MGGVVAPTATLLLIGSTWRGVLLWGPDHTAQRVQVMTGHRANGLRHGWAHCRGVKTERRWQGGWPRSDRTCSLSSLSVIILNKSGLFRLAKCWK